MGIPSIKNPQSTEAGNATNRGGQPFMFQILDPGFDEPLYPVLLALHIPPDSVRESNAKSQTLTQTLGGYVEFNWPDDNSSISCSSSSGIFIGMENGLSSGDMSHRTIAWERKQDLVELFRQNGCVFNSSGIPVLRGRVMCICDRGLFIGHFKTLEETQEDTQPWMVSLAWEFEIEKSLHKFSVRTL